MSNTFVLISGFKKIPFYIILSAQEHNSKIDFPFDYNMCTIYIDILFFSVSACTKLNLTCIYMYTMTMYGIYICYIVIVHIFHNKIQWNLS
jgi:hypothetical protein